MEKQYIIVHPRQRYLEVPYNQQMFGVYLDVGMEYKYFKCPRFVGSKQIDITTCHVFVNYISMAGKPGQYECRDVTVVDDHVTFSWELSGNLFDKNEHGNIYFAIQAKRIDTDGNLVNVFNTQSARGKACETIEPGKYIEEKHADIILQMMADMEMISAKAEDMEKVFEDAMKMLPSKISDLENDVNYATEDYVEKEIAEFDFIKVVDALPEVGLPNRFYLVPKSDATDNDLFDEYIWANGKWEFITTKHIEIDLTEYVKRTDYATKDKAGIIKPYYAYGTDVDSNGLLRLIPTTDAHIINKSDAYRPLTTKQIDLFTKIGITTNTEVLTSEEQQSAKNWLGVNDIKKLSVAEYRLWDLDVGIYAFDLGVKFIFGLRTDQIITPASNGILQIIFNQNRKGFLLYNLNIGVNEIIFGNLTENTGMAYWLNLEYVSTRSNSENVTGKKTFITAPRMTAELPVDDNSINIPNTQWVNSLLNNGRGIMTNQPDENGEYHFRIFGSKNGIYLLKPNTKIYYYGQTDTNQFVNSVTENYLFIFGDDTLKSFFIIRQVSSYLDSIYVMCGISSENAGNITSHNIANAVDRNTNQTITGVKTFSTQPLITAVQEDYTESSTKIPTMAWVQGVLSEKIDSLEMLIDESGVLG